MSDDGIDTADVPAEPVDTGADASAPEATDDAGEPVDLADAPPEPEAPEAPPAGDVLGPAADVSDPVEVPVDAEEPVDLGEAPEPADVVPEEPRDWQEGEAVDLGRDAAPDSPQEAETDDLVGADLSEPDLADSPEPEATADRAGEDLATPVDDEQEPSEAPTGDLAEEPHDADEPTAAEGVEERRGAWPAATEKETAPDTDAQEPDIADVEHEAASDVTDAAPEPTVDELTDAAGDEARPADELRTEYHAEVADELADDPPSDAEPVEAPETSDQADAAGDLGNSPENEALTRALADKGLSLEPVGRFDYSDNPILSYRESGQPEDIAYAVNAWNDEIAPGIAAGATRDDFAAYDREHGLEGQRQLAGVYDYMLGEDNAIWGNERADGTLDPGGGRHRLEQASLNGVKYVPYKSRGSRA